MHNFFYNLSHIHFSFDIKGKRLEFIPALYLVWWGVWVANPFWNTFTTSSVYSTLAELAPEWMWGTTVLVIGILFIIFLFGDNLQIRLVLTLLSCFTFMVLCITYALGNIASTGLIAYGVMALCSWLGYTELLSSIRGKTSLGNTMIDEKNDEKKEEIKLEEREKEE